MGEMEVPNGLSSALHEIPLWILSRGVVSAAGHQRFKPLVSAIFGAC